MIERRHDTYETFITPEALLLPKLGTLGVNPDVVYFAAAGESGGGSGGATTGSGTGVGGTSSSGGEVIREFVGPQRRERREREERKEDKQD